MKDQLTKKIPTKIIFLIVVVCAILGVFLQEGITAGSMRKVVIGIIVISLVFGFYALVEKKPNSNKIEEAQNEENKKTKPEGKKTNETILSFTLLIVVLVALIFIIGYFISR